MLISKKNGRRLLFVTAFVLLCFFGGSWFVAGKLIEPANRPVGDPPEGMRVETYQIQREDGGQIATWVIPTKESRLVIVLLHPIRGNRKSMLGRAKLFSEAGYSVVMIDFQAHGESPGEYVTAGHLEKHDAQAAVKFAKERFPGQKVGVLGWSMGGAAALLAGPMDIDLLVIEAVYPTIEEAIKNRVGIRLGPAKHVLAPALLVQLKPRLGFSPQELRPIDEVPNVGCPLLVIGGENDLHTTAEETRRIFEAAAQPKALLMIPEAEHCDFLAHSPDKYRKVVLEFMREHLVSRQNVMSDRNSE